MNARETAARLELPALMSRWLPDGRVEGHEFVARNPRRADRNAGSFKVNLRSGRWADFANSEARFAMLARSNPERAKELVALAQADVTTRHGYYQQLVEVHRTAPGHADNAAIAESEDES